MKLRKLEEKDVEGILCVAGLQYMQQGGGLDELNSGKCEYCRKCDIRRQCNHRRK